MANGMANLAGPGGLPKDGNEKSQTQSVISPATVTITSGDEASRQAAETLTQRDAATANQSLKNTLTLQDTAKLQADMKKAQENAQAGQMVGSVVFNVVGDISQKNGWADGSPEKIILHGIAGFVTASASGQNGATGAIAAMTNEALTKTVNDYIAEQLPIPAGASDDEKRQILQDRKVLGEAAAQLIGAASVAAVGGSGQQMQQGAAIALTADRFNRQLHKDEKAAIHDAAAGNKAVEERLTRAACFAVKCWAEYPEGSPQWNQAYVSVGESIGLAKELAWVEKEKQANGLFVYTTLQQASDDFKAGPMRVMKNAGKTVGGALSIITGRTICAVGGCKSVGGPLLAFGASEAMEGVTGLYNQYQGNGSAGFNPLRQGFNAMSPQWGDTAYDTSFLFFSALSIGASVPAKIGSSDGINRADSMFGVTVPRWQNPIVNPISNQILLSTPAAQGLTLYGLGSKVPAIESDISTAKSKQ